MLRFRHSRQNVNVLLSPSSSTIKGWFVPSRMKSFLTLRELFYPVSLNFKRCIVPLFSLAVFCRFFPPSPTPPLSLPFLPSLFSTTYLFSFLPCHSSNKVCVSPWKQRKKKGNIASQKQRKQRDEMGMKWKNTKKALHNNKEGREAREYKGWRASY